MSPAQPEAVETIRRTLRTLVEATLSEPGHLSSDWYESASVPGTFVTLVVV